MKKISLFRGMSLLEMVMVMLIMGLSIAIVTPSLDSSFRRRKLSIEARKLKDKIIYAQQSAINKQRVHRVTFDSPGNQYTISYDMNSTNVFVPIETVDTGNNISINATEFLIPAANVIDFDHFGTPTDSGNVNLIDPDGTIIQINVADVTGKVEIL